MSKKNIGAALTVIAASAAVATAYATTVSDLENDKHTNSLITEEDKEVDSSYSFVKSDYTKEVKNTKIAGTNRDAKKASQEIKKDIAIENTAKTLVKKQIIEAEKIAEEKAKEEANKEEVQDIEVASKGVEVTEEKNKEIVSYDDESLDALIEGKAQEEVKDIVVYNDENLDDLTTYEAKANEAKIEEKPVEENLDNKTEEAKQEEPQQEEIISNEEKAPVLAEEVSEPIEEVEKTEEVEEVKEVKEVKEVEEAPVVLDKYVNTASLNIRSSKDASNQANIVRTINAGDKLVGHVEGNWFVTNEGYVSLDYLANNYPQDLVNKIKAEAEAKKAEEAKAAEGARLAEEARKKEEARLAEEAKKQEVKETVQEVETVVEEQAMDYQAPVSQGAQGAVNSASQFVGYSYVWGASDPNVGFDCSGLTSYAYRQVGVNLPHSSKAQFNCGYAVDTNNLKPGDLVFFSFNGGGIDHVGMITGSDGSFIHASTPNTGVRYDNIFNGSFQTAYRGARRIY